jgi:hypothetical protein
MIAGALKQQLGLGAAFQLAALALIGGGLALLQLPAPRVASPPAP